MNIFRILSVALFLYTLYVLLLPLICFERLKCQQRKSVLFDNNSEYQLSACADIVKNSHEALSALFQIGNIFPESHCV